jgi:hypothetical protein
VSLERGVKNASHKDYYVMKCLGCADESRVKCFKRTPLW